MKSVLIVIEYGEGRGRRQAWLTATGWQIRGHPESLMPAILDRVMWAIELPAAHPAPHRIVARQIAEFLGGKVRWLKPDQPLAPGQVR